MDRRSFLHKAGFITISAVGIAGCRWGGSSDPPGRYGFPQGVASGDPRADGVVLWTRIVATAGTSTPIDARLQLAHDESFRDILLDDAVRARPEWDFTVRHKVTGLPPSTRFFYRFVAGGDTSPVGRTLTAPPPGAHVERLRIAVLSCQDWSANHWDALNRLAGEDLDLVVFLGDYIYESTAPSLFCPPEAAHPVIRLPQGRPSGAYQIAETLDDYRTLYRTYRSDPRLQVLHARHPFIVIWDDHEFSDNCWQAHETYTDAQPENLPRRAFASRAWFEYVPADVVPDASGRFDALAIRRDFPWGDLAHLVATDGRLFRTQPPVDRAGAEDLAASVLEVGGHRIVPLPVELAAEARAASSGEPPTMLGASQEDWWRDTLRTSQAQWKLWCNNVMLMRLQADLRSLAPAPYNTLVLPNPDQWDGYTTARNRLLRHLREDGVTNVVALTGDIHAFAAGVVMDDYDGTPPRPALVEIVGAGVSSESLYYSVDAAVRSHPLGLVFAGLVSRVDNGALRVTLDDTIRGDNPWIAHMDTNAIGYFTVDITAERLEAQLVHMVDTRAGPVVPGRSVSGTTRVIVMPGSPALEVIGAS